MAKYRTVKGSRTIIAASGTEWTPSDTGLVRDGGEYRLAKQRGAGWTLYSDAADGFTGEPCGTRVLEAIDEAEQIIARSEQQAPQHEVTRSLDIADAEGDDEVWDEPRAEVSADELFTLRAGVVVEAKTVQGTRCRLRLAAAPTHSTQGTAFLEGPKAELYEVDVDSVTLIGVMPRKGDTIHAQARTYTTPRSAAELPEGTRVRAGEGRHEGRWGTVNGIDVGRVDNPGHRNHGRAYVGVEWDAVAGDMGAGRRNRPFVDELRLVGLSKPMRRKLDRDPWPGGEGNTVVSDGRGVDAVLTSTIVILAEPAGGRTDEQQIARAVQLAMPGLDFHTNTTSLSAIRVYAKRAEGESRDGEDVLARNDDIAEALRLAGFYVSRRGVGQAVYASVEHSPHAGDPMCAVESHKGEAAPWIAVLSTENPFEAPYACRACVRRQVEGERALDHADPERPYIVRMWDETGRTLKVADDASSLDFISASTRDEARTISEDILVAGGGRGWRHEQGASNLRRVHRVTVDRALFYRGGELRRVERVIESNGLPEDPRTAELRRAGATLRRWLAAERTDGPAAFAPNSIVRFGPEMIADFETALGAEARPELVEAARTINAFEDGAPSGGEVGQLGDVDR